MFFGGLSAINAFRASGIKLDLNYFDMNDYFLIPLNLWKDLFLKKSLRVNFSIA